jgi:hypothetical protein
MFLHWFNFELDRGYTSCAGKLCEHVPIGYGWPSWLATGHLKYLLETKWFKPELVGATRGKKQDTVIVKVDYLGDRYRAHVVLDKKTHLPAEVGYTLDPPNKPNEPDVIYRLHDYVEADGIKLPSRVSTPYWGKSSPRKFEINADHDPEFLIRPPDINAGKYQWRKKG